MDTEVASSSWVFVSTVSKPENDEGISDNSNRDHSKTIAGVPIDYILLTDEVGGCGEREFFPFELHFIGWTVKILVWSQGNVSLTVGGLPYRFATYRRNQSRNYKWIIPKAANEELAIIQFVFYEVDE